MKSQKRLFIGIPIEETAKKKIEAVQVLWKEELKEIKMSPIPIENYHLTLHFLGDIPDVKIPALEKNLDQHRRIPAFFYALNRFLAFPELKKARVLALSGSIGNSPLSQLHYQMKESLQDLGWKLEERLYIPHLTLFRLQEHGLSNPLPMGDEIRVPIRSFALYESSLTQQGSQYQILRKWELK